MCVEVPFCNLIMLQVLHRGFLENLDLVLSKHQYDVSCNFRHGILFDEMFFHTEMDLQIFISTKTTQPLPLLPPMH